MTASLDLVAFMSRTGWSPISEGPAGTMWSLRDSNTQIGVPAQIEQGSIEWQGVVDRLSAAATTDPAGIEFLILHEHLDEALLRAANDDLIIDSIPLTAGQTMVDSANKMLRAAATTARGPKANVGGYLADGDRIYELARMGHTRRGSYLIPVLMPIPAPEETSTPEPPMPGLEFVEEPIQRRTMRTFAEALTAVSRLVVEPAVTPKPSVAGALVVAGVSRQFLDAMHAIVSQGSVRSFGAQFTWAGAVTAPKRDAGTVEIPHDAAPLIATAAVHMSHTAVESTQTMTGPIVDWHHEPGAAAGWIGVQTVRKGHELVVRVELVEADLYRALEYARESRTVVVRGVPAGGRGKAVRIARPESFTSLDELMLQP